LSRVAQAFDSLPASVFVSSSLKAGMLAGMLLLGGCGAGGFSLEQADVDRSIVTSSTPATPSSDDANLVADQATIRNAVSSADVEALAGKDISWANSETGSRGAIMQLAENKADGQLCRHFTATRESFDGVALFKGEACMVGYGAWRMQAFTAQ
jgi:hypothetical protein